MTVEEFNEKYCSICGSQMCIGEPDEIAHCGYYQGDIEGIAKLYFPERGQKFFDEVLKGLENDPGFKKLVDDLNRLLGSKSKKRKKENTMQKCKIFEARDEKALEERYNEWVEKEFQHSPLNEVTHMNTFMKDGWYKMVILYK